MEFEPLVWGHAGTEPGEAGQSPPFDLQGKNTYVNTTHNKGSFLTTQTKKARDPSALI